MELIPKPDLYWPPNVTVWPTQPAYLLYEQRPIGFVFWPNGATVEGECILSKEANLDAAAKEALEWLESC